jgi:hypothetical protein
MPTPCTFPAISPLRSKISSLKRVEIRGQIQSANFHLLLNMPGIVHVDDDWDGI